MANATNPAYHLLDPADDHAGDRKSTRLNSSHDQISYAVFCLKKKKKLAMILVTNVPINKPDAALHNWLGGVGVPVNSPQPAHAAVNVKRMTASSQGGRSEYS